MNKKQNSENSSLENRDEGRLGFLSNKDFLCAQLESLNMSFCNLYKLPKIIFVLKHLTHLNISYNCLKNLPSEIGNLHNLIVLNLSGNKLTSLPESIKHIHNLNSLDLSSNNFTFVPNVLHSSLGVLRILDLSANNIQEFGCAPQCINNLTVLKLACNELISFPKWILYSICQLIVFDISGNDIFTTFQINDFCTANLFESLQVLNLEKCKLSCDKINFLSRFKNLKILQIGNSNKKEIIKFENYLGNLNMDALKNLKTLKCLYMQNVQIPTLPLGFSCLKNLETLDLSENLLTWLPESLCDLVSLKILNLMSNQLLFLPSNINKLINLQELHLASNELCSVPEIICSLNNLEYVDFYDNKIDEIDFMIFNKKNLKGIDLGLNCLKYNLSECDNDVVKMQYEYLKNSLRQQFNYVNSRSDVQIIKAPSGSESYDRRSHSSVYSDNTGMISDSEDFGLATHQRQCNDNFEENWEDEVVEVEEDDFFNPNKVQFGSPGIENFKDGWGSEFRNNYCPAYDHVPSFIENYSRNIVDSTSKHTSVDGQFDSE